VDTFPKRFGDIRSRLAEPATPVTFFRVCKALALMWEEDPGRVNGEVVPYLDAHRHHWPEEMRTHPAFWEKLWLGEERVRFGPLCLISKLDLSFRKLGGLAPERIAAARDLEEMTSLDLRSNDLEDELLAPLADAKHLGRLEDLDLGDNLMLISPGAVLDLENLRILKLMHTGVQDSFLELLAAKPNLKLEQLWLTRTSITEAGLRALLEADGLENLRRLDITGLTLDYDSAYTLEKAFVGRWPHLELTRGR
jgi:Leucine-rich repeat (LRR) protein